MASGVSGRHREIDKAGAGVAMEKFWREKGKPWADIGHGNGTATDGHQTPS
jgi:hypothetical protein